MIKASAPGRAGIIGNPTDGYGGTVISCSLKEQAYATVDKADKLILETEKRTLVVEKGEDLELRGDVFDIPRAIIHYFRLGKAKLRIKFWSEIPRQAGLAGSTAILVSILGALLKYKGLRYNKYQFAEVARIIELDNMKIQCGYQDAYMCTFGGLNYMDFRTKEYYKELERELYATIEPLHSFVNHLPFLLAHTGVRRVSGEVLKPIREKWLEGDHLVREGYERVAHLAREGKKALLNQDWGRLGRLMNENHTIQQRLGASGEANDRLIEVARRHGAMGAKLAGAGGGGTIIALHLQPGKLIEKLEEAGADRILFLHPSEGLVVEGEV